MYTSKIISFLKSLLIVHNGTSVVPLVTSVTYISYYIIQLLIVDISYHIVGSWDMYYFFSGGFEPKLKYVAECWVPGILKSHFLERF